MRYIEYLSECIDIYDEHGFLQNENFPISSFFDIENYVSELKLDDEKSFINNLRSYVKSGARPEFISNLILSESDYLKIKKYYDTPIYKHIRSGLSEICCMCGGFTPSQLDHILDKKFHRTYFSFLRNLAPVCACNQSKKPADLTRSTLHPYIDTILKKRIVKFYYERSGQDKYRAIKIVPVDDYCNVKAVINHIESVFRGATMKRAVQSAGKRFGEVRSNYGNNLDDIKKYCINGFILNRDRYKTPNNWNSMSYVGIMDFYGIDYFI